MAYRCKIFEAVNLTLNGHQHMCTISEDVGINKEKEICLPNKESISCHRCERTTMDAKCEMYMNCRKNFIGICKKNAAKQGILEGS